MNGVPQITTFPSDVSANAVTDELAANGCAIIANHATDQQIAQLHSELQPYLDGAVS